MNAQKEAKALESQYVADISTAVYGICDSEKKEHAGGLESFEHYRERLTLEAVNAGKAYFHSWTKAFTLIVKELVLVGDQDAIKQIIHGVDCIKKRQDQKLQGQTVAAIMDYDVELLGKMYAIGRNLFDQDHLDDAITVFGLVVSLDPGYAICWASLGITLYSQGKFKESLEALKMASQIDSENPIPHFYAAKAHKKLGATKEAQLSLKLALEQASGKSEYAAVVTAIRAEQSKI